MKFLRIGLGLLALLTSLPAAAGPKQQTFQLRLSAQAMASDGTKKHGFNQSWRIYDRQGREVAELGGGDDGIFLNALNAVFQSPAPVGSERTLAWELGRLEEQDGSPLKKYPTRTSRSSNTGTKAASHVGIETSGPPKCSRASSTLIRTGQSTY